MPKGMKLDKRSGYSLEHYTCPCGWEAMGKNLQLRIKLHSKKCELSGCYEVPSVTDIFYVKDGANDKHQVVESINEFDMTRYVG